jgi:hypothetical protein
MAIRRYIGWSEGHIGRRFARLIAPCMISALPALSMPPAPLPVSFLPDSFLPAAIMPLSDMNMEDNMNNQFRTLKMSSKQNEGNVEITVIGLSPDPVLVSYKLEVSGQSTTRHSGSTRLSAGDRQILSRVRVSAQQRWCATLQVEQSNGVQYRLTDGTCG